MIFRFTLAAITAALTLTGCAQRTTSQVQDFASGSSLVTFSHVDSLTDDGSLIMVTVDGKDAEPLVRGETAELHMASGKHKVGGYVSTLLGYGRVTIQAIDVTAVPGQIKHVTYSVVKNKPTFTETAPTAVPPPAKKPDETVPVQGGQTQVSASAKSTSDTAAASPNTSSSAADSTKTTSDTAAASTNTSSSAADSTKTTSDTAAASPNTSSSSADSTKTTSNTAAASTNTSSSATDSNKTTSDTAAASTNTSSSAADSTKTTSDTAAVSTGI